MNIINYFEIEEEIFYYCDIKKVFEQNNRLKKLPIVLKILLESNLRKSKDNIEFNRIVNIFSNRMDSKICLYPSRAIMQEHSGIPALVNLASMRTYLKEKDETVQNINPQIITDLVIDPKLTNSQKRSKGEYEFIKWAGYSFSNLRIVPPGSGAFHPVNLEPLSTIIHLDRIEENNFIYPEIVIGADSNKVMVNSLGVLGWRVGGVEVESAILGHAIDISLPKVLGVKVLSSPKEGVTSSDISKSLIKKLEEFDLEGKVVEFYGEGLKHITLEDRTTISNLAPEYGALSSFFSIDDKTIEYFNKTRGSSDYSKLLKEYLKLQTLFYDEEEELDFDEVMMFDLSELSPSIIVNKRVKEEINVNNLINQMIINKGFELKDADVVNATIISNEFKTNPHLIIHAALLAKRAFDLDLEVVNYVNSLLLINSKLTREYLEKLGLLKYLKGIGFKVLEDEKELDFNLEKTIESDVRSNNLNLVSLISSDKLGVEKNNSLIKSNYILSASLIVAYSIIGTTKFNLCDDVIALKGDKEIKLKDLWPTSKEIGEYLSKLDDTLYKDVYSHLFIGNEFWQEINAEKSDTFNWNKDSTHIQPSIFFEDEELERIDIDNAGLLAVFEQPITTDHISPMGQISLYSQAAKYLESKGIKSFEYNTFYSRRGDTQVMLRSVFDNTYLQNKMVSKEGAFTFDYDEDEIVSIYEKSQRFKARNRALIVFTDKSFGEGKPRDWAAKSMKLLGVKAVIASSFEENYKTKMLEFGVLPLELIDEDLNTLKLKGYESISIQSLDIKVDSKVKAIIYKKDRTFEIELKARLDDEKDVLYYKNGGVLSYLLKKIK